MFGILLPVCSVFFSLLLCIVFFFKERINLIENKLYSIMIVLSFIDSCLVSALQIIALNGVNGIEVSLVQLFNKIDFVSLIVFTNCLFMYVLVISDKNIKDNPKPILKICGITDLVYLLLIIFTNLRVISSNGNFSVTGVSVNLTYMLCGFYIVSSMVLTALNIKKKDKRYIPIFAIAGLIIFLLIIFKINPYLIVISITLTFVDYIMYHTIENPDLKLIEELIKVRDLSEKYNNDKSVFLFNMTQQVRYPLNMIEQITDQLMEEKNIKNVKERTSELKTQAKKISHVINGVLDVSTVDAKKIKIVENKYNINTLLNGICVKYEKQLSKKEIEFRKNFDTGLPPSLYGDSIRLKQIINALISNSLKYTEEGFVELNVNSVVSFDVCRLIISVKDSGKGIKKEEIDKLFNNKEEIDIEKIEQEDITLDIAKKMVNLIGGTITVQTELNKGSEFTLIIDQKIDVNNRINKLLNKYDEISKKTSILFVSDKEEERVFYKKKLSGFDVVLSVGGEDCLNRIRNEEKYDAIIIKNEMEKISGEVTLQKLTQIKGFNSNSVIFLVNDKDKQRELIERGFKNVISKETNITKITNIINGIERS